ncbi:haloacid dehalogenase superfamily protein, subfamily IA, variant 3 with third motif having DD or ED [Burkholderia sp. Ch1-1]|uniref:Haloacid dehalogenase superfamily protein, subfamily IA, variant 3 with third motif having DD or ED n=2 Tax=Burkholderiaceae TaxID=119060 RepID=A0A5Q4ZB37_9BURK|nr:haloacid dehalogenase superfamily protein, subfamily IA, variant 3 with third motif having DD or ED [Burkholderia sp. Ch1-1]VVD32019.1 Haloacid dehalogenase superfamily protein, subfamily IA, variant 3 with third motif having DD or ED [Paraburkholderia dioscoreae]
MTDREAQAPAPDPHGTLSAGIFDVDGVLLASPHERAWREALRGFADEQRFTTAMYQSQVAGKPRLSGALAALQTLGVPNAAQRAEAYAESKQRRLEALIGAGAVSAFADALRFVNAVRRLGFAIAVASSSKNANDMMRGIRLDDHHSLFDVFGANVCGRDLPAGKPDPAIFLLAAAELPAAPANCFVVEDSPAGIEAARAGGMTALGVARLDDANSLWEAGANLVVTTLDEVDLDQLSRGKLWRRIYEQS